MNSTASIAVGVGGGGGGGQKSSAAAGISDHTTPAAIIGGMYSHIELHRIMDIINIATGMTLLILTLYLVYKLRKIDYTTRDPPVFFQSPYLTVDPSKELLVSSSSSVAVDDRRHHHHRHPHQQQQQVYCDTSYVAATASEEPPAPPPMYKQ